MEDSNFNYQMILNIVNFDEAKACLLIAQEDKRNKILKSVTRTMDSTKPINMIIQRLNDDSRCYLYGQIGRTETSKVNSIILYELLDMCFKIKNRSEVIETVKYLKEVFNTLTEDGMFKTDFFSLAVIIKAASMYKNDSDYINKIEDTITKATNKLNRNEYKKVTKKLLKEIENL